MAVIFICFAVNITAVEWLFIITAIFLVLITEILNSAIEYTVDLVTGDYHILARYAKDIAAAAVLFSSLYAVIAGMIILLPYFV
ncbi:undecaprenol kinase/diacylglycerol kinase (ATP) [Jeotgalicoccus aerolatus]|jgi:undecaprenol kinase|uniref:Undecaprenol kinase/diacylglycerol kinase (ATP) n=2 Tax=Jeotgalicoccus aerolatus TaxID=709510 RepID=A0A1G8ULT9_9STAP|nr:undecaprenol kinase/diacylglycerol kinase (ATP) [Jeotgalicoccus aerolatus]